MRTAAELHAQLVASVGAAQTAAMRADLLRLQQFLDDPATASQLDEATIGFARDAQRLVIGLTAALHAVLETHRGLHDHYGTLGCRECDTLEGEPCTTLRRVADVASLYRLRRIPVVDAGEAWRRASARLAPREEDGELVTSVQEITDGFVVRHLYLELPLPPTTPGPDTDRVLIVDRTTGQMVIWPLMPLATIDSDYQRYRAGDRL